MMNQLIKDLSIKDLRINPSKIIPQSKTRQNTQPLRMQ